MTKRCLMAVGAHADDIELLAGGTLLKYHDQGYDVVYVMSTNNMSGSWSRVKPDGTKESTLPPYHVIEPQRKLEAAAAAKLFGTVPIHLEHPQRHYTRDDGKVEELRYGSERPKTVAPNTPTIITAYEDAASVKRLSDLMLEKNPEAVFTHALGDWNIEHLGTCLLVTKAYRKAVESGYGGMLLYVPNGTATFGERMAQWETFVDISRFGDRKLEAIGTHACQFATPHQTDYPILEQWQFWGTACGCRYAEVFVIAGHPAVQASTPEFTLEIIQHRQV